MGDYNLVALALILTILAFFRERTLSGDINAAITKIKGLSIDGLAKLDVNSVKQFQAAAAIRQKLSATSLVTA